MLTAVVAAEGANAVGMYAVGSFWYVSATYVVLTAIGVALLVVGKSTRATPDSIGRTASTTARARS